MVGGKIVFPRTRTSRVPVVHHPVNFLARTTRYEDDKRTIPGLLEAMPRITVRCEDGDLVA